jgi:cell division protein YceG involved in septum cleavage
MKRKTAIIISIIVVAIFSAGGLYAYAKYFGPQTVMQTNSDKINCIQGNVLDGVGRQARFTILSTCERVIGIVHDMSGTKQDDGDYQFNLEVQEPYNKLLNQGNNNQVNGMLVIEIIPKDQNNNPYVQIPKNGDRIQAYGAWVTDNPHGWNELHPAWKIKILSV